MTIKSYKIVLSDKLYSIYKKVTAGCVLNAKERQAYENLLGNVELDILTNAAQLSRCRESYELPDAVFNDLYPALLNIEKQKDLSLHDLSKETLFKLIITQADGDEAPPFLNIKKQHIKRNYTITRLHDENRDTLISYISSLLNDAEKILIHDKYFSEEHRNIEFFELLPDKKITIQYIENSTRENGNFIRNACIGKGKYVIIQCDTTQQAFNRFSRSHDRYLIINDKIEITLTSGFSFIWNQEKEITCIIRNTP